MKLYVQTRTGSKKSDIKTIRTKGNIPAIIYGGGEKPAPLIIDGVAFDAAVRSIRPGRLSTCIFSLLEGDRERRAIIKDIQYHPTSYSVLHLDFEELQEKKMVSLNIPLYCTGVVDCVGIKLGGFLRQVKRKVRVRCLPQNIPAEFAVNIQDLGIKQARRIKEIVVPEMVEVLDPLNDVIAVIAKK